MEEPAGGLVVSVDGRELSSPVPPPEGYARGGDLIEQRVKLTRDEFRRVAEGTYPTGEMPEHGPPTVTVVDKRGRNNQRAAERAAEQKARAEQKEAQTAWTRQAAGALWWMAQGQGQRGQTALAERTLAKRDELVAGAQRRGIM